MITFEFVHYQELQHLLLCASVDEVRGSLQLQYTGRVDPEVLAHLLVPILACGLNSAA